MKLAPLPKPKPYLTHDMSPETHISYQVTVVANLMAFGNSARNVKQFGINLRQWRVLACIGQMGPLTARQIVAAIHQDKATISRAVAELEKKGFIDKMPNKLHKRSPYIWMTAEGKRAHDRILPSFTGQASLFTNVLTTQEKTQLCRILDKMKAHIEEVRITEGLE